MDAGKPPPGGTELANGFGEPGRGGPHPPVGDKAHRYFFRLYALAGPYSPQGHQTAFGLHQAVEGRQLASVTLVGLYHR